MQRWFTETGHPSARDPYFLYAASNVGSMLALLGYPTIVEPNIPLRGDGSSWATQINLWAVGYCALLVLLIACRLAVAFSRQQRQELSGSMSLETEAPAHQTLQPESTLSFFTRLRWIGLAFVPSSLMLGVTTYLTLDIAAIPLLWVIPLSIYLLSFISSSLAGLCGCTRSSSPARPLVILIVLFMLESCAPATWRVENHIHFPDLIVCCFHDVPRELARTNRSQPLLGLPADVSGRSGRNVQRTAGAFIFQEVINTGGDEACFRSLSADTGLLIERLPAAFRSNTGRVRMTAGILQVPDPWAVEFQPFQGRRRSICGSQGLGNDGESSVE